MATSSTSVSDRLDSDGVLLLAALALLLDRLELPTATDMMRYLI